MEFLPVGKRTRLQKSLKWKNLINEQKRARKDARREWKKKKDISSVVDDDSDGEEIEFLDRSEYESLGVRGSQKNSHKKDVGIENHAKLSKCDDGDVVMVNDGLVNGEDSDDSLKILEDRYNPFNGDHDDTDDDDNQVDDHAPHSSTYKVISSDSDGEKRGNLSTEENKGGTQARVEISGKNVAIFSEESSVSESSSKEDNSDNNWNSPSSESSSSDDDDDDHEPEPVNDDGHVLTEKHEEGKKKRINPDSEFEILPSKPKNTAKQLDFEPRIKPTSPRKKTGDGSVSHPLVIDMDETSSDIELDDTEEEVDDDENNVGNGRFHDPTKPHNHGCNPVENGGNRKKGRELELPRKRKRVRGLKSSELQKVLLNTLSENGDAGLDDFMSSTTMMGDLHLPLKFSFGVEKISPPEKSEEDEELESVWKELDFALGVCHIGCDTDTSCLDDKEDVFPSENTVLQEKLCKKGKHHLIMNDEIGIICKFCSFVHLEIKYVTQDFNKDPFGRAENRSYGRFPHNKDNVLNGLEFLDSSYESQAGKGTCIDDTEGTVWDLIPGTKRTLYPHQQEGFEFIWRNIAGAVKMEDLGKPTKFGLGGCIICHAPGTGKTRLAIVFLQSYMKQYPMSKPVIIAPKSMLLTWEEEFAKWNSGINFFNMNVDDLSGNEDPKILSMVQKGQRFDRNTLRAAKLCTWKMGKGVLGISYNLFEKLAGERKGTEEKIRQALLKQTGILVLDEGHTPRNDGSLIWKVLSNVDTKRRIILSGTPFQNNFHELYNTISLVREEFVDPNILSCNKSNKGRSFSRWGRVVNHQNEERRINELKNQIKSFVHVHKGEILRMTLKGLFHSFVVLKPSTLQNECFHHLGTLKGALELDHFFSIASVHPFLLRECENPPQFVNKEEFQSLLKTHKTDLDAGVKTRFLFELIKLSKGEKILVFSQYLNPLSFLGELLMSHFDWTEDRELLFMHGAQETKKRQSLIRHFNNPISEARLLLASTKACCEGIHLVGASRVVLLDVVWNPSVERQAISRAYRLGQKKDVFVYHLVTGKQETDKFYRKATKDRLSELVFSSSEKREFVEKTSISSSRVSEDRILQEMLQHEKMKSIFKKIIYQPNSDHLIQTFGPLNL